MKHLDASENLLVSLEPSICDLFAVERLELKGNPLQKPPVAIARQGIGAIRRYFQELAASGETTSNGARLVLLGHGEAGKTSLQRGLRAGAPRPAAIDERTIQLDIYSLALGDAPSQTKQVIALDVGPRRPAAVRGGSAAVHCEWLALPAHSCPRKTLRPRRNYAITRPVARLFAGGRADAIVQPVLTNCDKLMPQVTSAPVPEPSRTRRPSRSSGC